MVRESGISATKPVFPTYLLPSFKLPFYRRQSASSASSGSTPSTSPATSPASSPPHHDDALLAALKPSHLTRAAPNTLRCSTCSADLAFSSQIISKGFTGRYGRAFLVAPPGPPAPPTLLNIRVGKSENRQLATGWHVVADITCGTCASKLGWKYVDAKEASQKYKVGKFILEVERVVTYRSWEDAPRDEAAEDDEYSGSTSSARDDGDISFDSDDSDECEDVFAGTWDPEVVERRRRSTMVSRRSQADSDH